MPSIPLPGARAGRDPARAIKRGPTRLPPAPAFAVMAIVETDAAGPAARQARDCLLDSFGRYFAGAPALPGDLPGPELVGPLVGGVYSAIARQVAAGRRDLGHLLPST